MAINLKDFAKKNIDLSSTGENLRNAFSGNQTNDALDLMFNSSDNQNRYTTQDLPTNKLHPYTGDLFGLEGQPFTVVDDDEMEDLIEDIQANGIMEPIIVRALPDQTYTILSGHRRHHAALRAGLEKVPCRVVECDDATAAVIVVQTNMLLRQKIKHSEKAKAYKLYADATNHQGKKLDIEDLGPQSTMLTNAPVESRRQRNRYIRLNYLIPELLEDVDEELLSVSAGAQVSFLPEELQRVIKEETDKRSKAISNMEAITLRNRSNLTEEEIRLFLRTGRFTTDPIPIPVEPVEAVKEKKRIVKIPFDLIAEYFEESDSDEDIAIIIVQALKETN